MVDRSTHEWSYPVVRIDLAWMIRTVGAFGNLRALSEGQPSNEALHVLTSARSSLQSLFDQGLYRTYLRVSRQQGQSLFNDIAGAIDRLVAAGNAAALTEAERTSILARGNQFAETFLAEIGIIPSYLVTPKAGYDVDTLIASGTVLFPDTLSAKVPDAVADANEAGRALAFELATSCGFHAFRAVESTVRRYWDEMTDQARPKLQTLGNFASEMKKRGIGDEKIIESMQQMTKLHRNPLIHPEVILSVNEAIDIIGMARSLISPMLNVLPDAPLTTSSPAITS